MSPYSRSSAIRLTWGSSRDCAQPAPAWVSARRVAATPTRIRLGRASMTRSGVGPAENRAESTPVVASSPNAVNTPESRLRPIVMTVSRGSASQASRTACDTRAGRRRAMVRKLTPVILPTWACQSERLSSPSSGAGSGGVSGIAAV
ncbi:hypothetical protein ACFQX6_54160 [Streptosporangium lutulentum]